jgi:1,4-alpha-glucan branching enzyme
MDRQSFAACALDWTVLDQLEHRHWLEFHRRLLSLRHREIIPRLQGPRLESLGWKPLTARALSARWTLGDGSELVVLANLGNETPGGVDLPRLPLLYATPSTHAPASSDRELPPWSVFWYLSPSGAAS